MGVQTKGTLYGLGVGPGDPELLTIKALRILESCPVIAYHQAPRRKSNALTIVEPYLKPHQKHIVLTYPVTTEHKVQDQAYEQALEQFYQQATQSLADILDQGQDIAVLGEGDPFFYGSFMYLYDRLTTDYHVATVPGITSVSAATAALATPLCYRNQVFMSLSGVLSKQDLVEKLQQGDAFAIMKLGRNFTKVKEALEICGLLDRALYIERATQDQQKIVDIGQVDPQTVPYFSIILVPGQKYR